MASRIPQATIDAVREATDIVAVISEFVPLKKAGNSYKGLCPFHQEKTPSFWVSPEKQIYHCFGCGVGGNIFTFLQEHEHVGFVDAVRWLADRAGIRISAVDTSPASEGLEEFYHVNGLACTFYLECIQGPQGRSARHYLGSRGVDQEMGETFQLGWAPSRWDGLIEYARSKGISLDPFLKAGLVLKSERGSFYDRFRGRIIFPIHNVAGRIIGFGGRTLDEEVEPKYMNSPESPVYQKGKSLYGLHQTRESIRRTHEVVVVEGYMDLLAMVRAGYSNSVATLGTALTTDQARLLKRYTGKVLLVYDGDEAGRIASLRAIDQVVAEGLAVRVVSLPDGSDPDQIVRTSGRQGLSQALGRSQDLVEFKLAVWKGGRAPASVEEQAELVHELAQTIGTMSDPVLRRLYIKKAAQRLSVPEEAFYLGRGKRGSRGRSDKALEAIRAVRPVAESEYRLVTYLSDPRFQNHLHDMIDLTEFECEEARRLAQMLLEMAEAGQTLPIASLIASVGDKGAQRVISGAAMLAEGEGFDVEREARGCLTRMRRYRISEQMKRVKERIREAEGHGDCEAVTQLQRELVRLTKMKVAQSHP